MNRHQEAIDALTKIAGIAALRADNHMLEAREVMLGATSNVAVGSSPADIHRINQHANQATDLIKLSKVTVGLAEAMSFYGLGETGSVRIVMFDRQGTPVDAAEAIKTGRFNDDEIDFHKGIRFDSTQSPPDNLMTHMETSGLVRFAKLGEDRELTGPVVYFNDPVNNPRYTAEQINARAAVIALVKDLANSAGLTVIEPKFVGNAERVMLTVVDPNTKDPATGTKKANISVPIDGATIVGTKSHSPSGELNISSKAIEASMKACFPKAFDMPASSLSAYMQGVQPIETAPRAPVAAATPARSAPRNDDRGPDR